MPAGSTKVMSVGFRAALLFNATLLAAASAIQVVSKPQKTFRGENVVIDSVLVGPFCNVTMPTVGSDVQIIGGGNSTTVPGTLFAPNQNGALDFEMYIAEQGNDVSFNVTNNQATLPLSFAAAIFGVQVTAVPGQPAVQGGTLGVLVPGAFG